MISRQVCKFIDGLQSSNFLSVTDHKYFKDQLNSLGASADSIEDLMICKLANHFKKLSSSQWYDVIFNSYNSFKKQSATTSQPLDSIRQLENRYLNKGQNVSYLDKNSNNIRAIESQKKIFIDKLKILCRILETSRKRQAFKRIFAFQGSNSKKQITSKRRNVSAISSPSQKAYFFEGDFEGSSLNQDKSMNQLQNNFFSPKSQLESLLQSGNTSPLNPSILKQHNPNITLKNNSHSHLSPKRNCIDQITSRRNSQIENLKNCFNVEMEEYNSTIKQNCVNSTQTQFNILKTRDCYKLIQNRLDAGLIEESEAMQLVQAANKQQQSISCPFKPSINKENEFYQNQKKSDLPNTFDRLYKDGVQHKTHKSQILTDIKNYLELKDCTFKPKIQKYHSPKRNSSHNEEVSVLSQLEEDLGKRQLEQSLMKLERIKQKIAAEPRKQDSLHLHQTSTKSNTFQSSQSQFLSDTQQSMQNHQIKNNNSNSSRDLSTKQKGGTVIQSKKRFKGDDSDDHNTDDDANEWSSLKTQIPTQSKEQKTKTQPPQMRGMLHYLPNNLESRESSMSQTNNKTLSKVKSVSFLEQPTKFEYNRN